MKEKRDFEWYHDHIDYDEYCLYPNLRDEQSSFLNAAVSSEDEESMSSSIMSSIPM